ncbi:hypothetical protein ACQ4PT_040247 [Festuca glaucescens]
MPTRKQPKNSETPSAAEMDDLPEGVLPIILSFLPAHDAVRTCALTRRWRNVSWTSAPALRITAVRGFGSADRFIEFVDRLLFLRRHADWPLESSEFEFDDSEYGFDYLSPDWLPSAEHLYLSSLQSALDCNVRFLRFRFAVTDIDPL